MAADSDAEIPMNPPDESPNRFGEHILEEFLQRFFCAGLRARFLAASASCDEDARVARHRKRRRQRLEDEAKRRAARALNLVQMGELSAARLWRVQQWH